IYCLGSRFEGGGQHRRKRDPVAPTLRATSELRPTQAAAPWPFCLLIRTANGHVCFTPKSGHVQRNSRCLLRAKSGHASIFGVKLEKTRRLRALSLGRDLALYQINVTLEKFLRVLDYPQQRIGIACSRRVRACYIP